MVNKKQLQNIDNTVEEAGGVRRRFLSENTESWRQTPDYTQKHKLCQKTSIRAARVRGKKEIHWIHDLITSVKHGGGMSWYGHAWLPKVTGHRCLSMTWLLIEVYRATLSAQIQPRTLINNDPKRTANSKPTVPPGKQMGQCNGQVSHMTERKHPNVFVKLWVTTESLHSFIKRENELLRCGVWLYKSA